MTEKYKNNAIMTTLDCQNLTKIAADLRNLKPRVDLAIKTFEPADGVKAQEAASLVLNPMEPLLKLGVQSYEYLINKVGSEEKLLDRVSKIKVGGIAKDDLLERLKKEESNPFPWEEPIKKFAERKDFIPRRDRPEILTIIRLTPKELGFDGGIRLFAIYAAIKHFGLELCPQDLGLYLALDQELVLGHQYGVNVASEPIRDTEKTGCIIQAYETTSGIIVQPIKFDDYTVWDNDTSFYFCLPKHSKRRTK
jgi:hypothetical protein